MKKLFSLCMLFLLSVGCFAQSVYTLDSCRHMAIENNKELQVANEEIRAAG